MLGLVYEVTKTPIAQTQEAAKERSLVTGIPGSRVRMISKQ